MAAKQAARACGGKGKGGAGAGAADAIAAVSIAGAAVSVTAAAVVVAPTPTPTLALALALALSLGLGGLALLAQTAQSAQDAPSGGATALPCAHARTHRSRRAGRFGAGASSDKERPGGAQEPVVQEGGTELQQQRGMHAVAAARNLRRCLRLGVNGGGSSGAGAGSSDRSPLRPNCRARKNVRVLGCASRACTPPRRSLSRMQRAHCGRRKRNENVQKLPHHWRRGSRVREGAERRDRRFRRWGGG